MTLTTLNTQWRDLPPAEIVRRALERAERPAVTTNFRPYESAILHLITQVCPDIDVIWCDTGYNTRATYQHARELIERLQLNIHIYVPQQTLGFRTVMLGIPEVDTPEHKIFSEQVKLEPFRRAMQIHHPDVWFTNLRHGQTAFRDKIGIASESQSGILKVSPFYHYTDKDLDTYLETHQLPNEFRYYDPTKALANRECGIHQ